MTGRAALLHAAVRARRPEGPAGEPASRPTGMQEVEAWRAQGGAVQPWFTNTDEKLGGVGEDGADLHHSLNLAT
jgi:hypothetical protein